MPSFFHPIEIQLESGGWFEVTIDISYIIENNSIGNMEIFGRKCYDRQPDFAVCEDYTIKSIINLDTKQEINIKDAPAELKKEIESYFENNKQKLDEEAFDDMCLCSEDYR